MESQSQMKKTRNSEAPAAKRQWPRLSPENIPSLKGIMLNQEDVAQILNISRGGALIETDVRLCPHAKVGVKVLTTQGVFRIMGYVLRSSITALTSRPIYKIAVSFENPLAMLEDQSVPGTAY